jgi:dCMP deaminase
MRVTQDEYFMSIAVITSARSTCPRATVGAVLVKARNIIATGYNGTPIGTKHCEDNVCDVVNDHCVATVHAEANCIAQAAKHGHSVKDSVVYCTHKPCHNCMKLLINAGVMEVVYKDDYDDGRNDYPQVVVRKL